jgi:nucleotide-binding universal stress UspA family protein
VLVADNGDPAPVAFAHLIAGALDARVVTVTVDGADEPDDAPRVPAGTHVEQAGSAAAGLQRLMVSYQPILTVLGSSMAAAHGRVALGGTAERVLHGASRAVAVVPKGHGERALGTIGVGLLPTPDSLRALRAAATLSRAAGVPLLVLTVLRRSPDLADATELAARLAPETPAPTRGPAASILRAAITAAAREGEDARRGSKRLVVEPLVLVGDAVDALIRATARLGLLVLGSRGYGPPGVVLPGGAARRVLASARCPVLLVPRAA